MSVSFVEAEVLFFHEQCEHTLYEYEYECHHMSTGLLYLTDFDYSSLLAMFLHCYLHFPKAIESGRQRGGPSTHYPSSQGKSD